MGKRTVIADQAKGALAERDSTWVLVEEDDGSKFIEHSWSFVDPYGKKPPNEGSKRYTLSEFLNGDHPDGLKQKVRSAVKT